MYLPLMAAQVRARVLAELQRCGCLQLGQEAGRKSRRPGVTDEAPAQSGRVPIGCQQVA